MKSCITVSRVLAAGALMAFAISATAQQQAYPNKPIRFILPFSPGGGTTIVARLVGQKLTESWGQQVIVDNRPGGDTMIGTNAVAKAAPDGYTFLVAASNHVIVPLMHRSIPYDAIKDFAPVATLASGEQLLVLHPSVPANNLGEFVTLAKSKPGQLNYSSAGNGTTNHLASELLNIMTGIKVQHIPYNGGGPSLTGFLGGQVQMFFNNPLTLIPHIKGGKIKAIAISGQNRSPLLPQVPTFTEAGLPGFEVKFWYGVFAPASTPKQIIEKMSAEISKILATPDYRESLISQGVEPFVSTPEQFAALLKVEMARYAKIIKLSNIEIAN